MLLPTSYLRASSATVVPCACRPPPAFATGNPDPIFGAMQHLDLTDDEAAALTQELHNIAENDRYPFSPRIRTLRGILAKLRPEPVREPLPPPKVYAPPSKGRYKRRG